MKLKGWSTMVIYQHARFILDENDGIVSIIVNDTFDVQSFTPVMQTVPRLAVTQFGALKLALERATGEPVVIGTYKSIVEIEISSDEMQAFAKVNLTSEAYATTKHQVSDLILKGLNEAGVTDGMLMEAIDDMELCKKVVVAKGVAPINGNDAVLQYFELSEKKPQLKVDGGVDHYELQLVDKISKGEWLGDKIYPTEGIMGKTVRGEPLYPKMGRDYALKYDPETVDVIQESGREVLRAKIDGAVCFKDKRVGVDNHLIIHGDVDYNTGNIDFDGYVTIEGTVQDCFTVTATYDISIMSPMGIGAVELIESKRGNIYIKGGINGKGTVRIVAGKNVYVKFVNEATIHANGNINIGLYAYDSELHGQRIELSPEKGKIVGGVTHASHQIITGSIGNKSEKKTEVFVKGFDRLNLKEELDMLQFKYQDIISRANKLKRQLEVFELNLAKLDDRALNTYKAMMINYESIMDELSRVDEKTNLIEEILRTRGDGEVKIYKGVHPKSMLEIKKLQKRVNDLMQCSFYVKDNQLHVAD